MAKQNHPPFDAWLLSGDPLTPQQAYDLQEHLRICETCRQVESAWGQVERLVQAAGMLAPSAGFNLRWQARLEVQRTRQHRRQAWLFFIGMAALALLALGLLGLALAAIWQSPAQFFFGIIYRLAQLVQALGLVGFYMGDLVKALPGIPIVGIFFFTGFVTLLCVLWLVLFQQLTAVQRGVVL